MSRLWLSSCGGTVVWLVGCVPVPDPRLGEDTPANLQEAILELQAKLQDANDPLFNQDVVVGQCGEDGPQF